MKFPNGMAFTNGRAPQNQAKAAVGMPAPRVLDRHAMQLLALAVAMACSIGRAQASTVAAGDQDLSHVIRAAQPKLVKIYGAGGFRGLEPYQSGCLISDQGHILTVSSYVLDADWVTVVLASGAKHTAEVVGTDPKLEIALLKIDAQTPDYFSLAAADTAQVGQRVLAMSNLFGIAAGDEPVSVQHGVLSAKTSLSARRGVFQTPYHGDVWVVDAITSNPGAAGGAIVQLSGSLVGLIGKELRNSQDQSWLNYCLPCETLLEGVERIQSGETPPLAAEEPPAADPWTLESLGMDLVPNVLSHTPPFVDLVVSGGIAKEAGIQADDLIVLVQDQVVPSWHAFAKELARHPAQEPLRLTVLRDSELVEITLQPAGRKPRAGAP